MEYDPDDELLDAYRIELTTLRQRAEAAEVVAEQLREAMKVMGREIKVHRWGVDPGHNEDVDAAVARTDDNLEAKAAIDAAGGEG